jgi:acyl-CoA synthetase (NDP forming)
MPKLVSPFEEIFAAQNIAIIGASNNPTKLGFALVRNLLAQGKNVFPINPNIKEVLKVKAYPSVTAVPDPLTLAVIIISPQQILNAVEECGTKGIKYVLIVSEGFRETGAEELQEQLKNSLIKHNIRALGPNTMGIYDTYTPLLLSFIDMHLLKPGNVSISSQTGILAGALLQYINLTKHIGISKVIDLGNKIDLDHVDVLDYLRDEEKTAVIGMHIEGIADGQKLAEALKKTTSRKPVIILKGGVMEETKRVVASHTGSIAGDAKLFDSITKNAGAIRVNDFEEFIDVVKGFAYMPPPNGNKIAVITGSGGAGVVTIDSLLRNGLALAKLSPETVEALFKFIPEPGKILNPIDIWPSAIQQGLNVVYGQTISLLDADPNVDAIIALLFKVEDFKYDPKAVIKAAKNCTKPVFFAVQGHATTQMRDEFENNGLPTYSFGERIARVLGHMWTYKKFLKSSKSS